MSVIGDFSSNSVMGVVRKIVNHITGNIDPQIKVLVDNQPTRFYGEFSESTRDLELTIEPNSVGAEKLVATVNIPGGGGGSGRPTYSAGKGINITPGNAIEIDTAVTATKESVTALQNAVAPAFKEVSVGSDGKSLDFTALNGQVNNIVIPSSGGRTIRTLVTLNDMWTAITNGKIGDEFFVTKIKGPLDENAIFEITNMHMVICNIEGQIRHFSCNGKMQKVGTSNYYPLFIGKLSSGSGMRIEYSVPDSKGYASINLYNSTTYTEFSGGYAITYN